MSEIPLQTPPLPNEQGGSTIGARHLWLILYPHREYEADEVRGLFVNLFGREPDKCYSPQESKTEMWWLGWVTREESKLWVSQNG